jgi:hypothetical protein
MPWPFLKFRILNLGSLLSSFLIVIGQGFVKFGVGLSQILIRCYGVPLGNHQSSFVWYTIKLQNSGTGPDQSFVTGSLPFTA